MTAALLSALLACAPPPAAPVPVVAGVTGYTSTATLTEGLREPAALAALPGGQVAVADLAARDVVVFERDGTEAWRTDLPLLSPAGLALDDQGLWVADAEAHRLHLLDPTTGAEVRQVEFDDSLAPVGIAALGGGALWVSFPANNTVAHVTADGRVDQVVESYEGAPLRAPRGLWPDGEGGVFVAEALGARVLRLDAQGGPRAAFGVWGLEGGRFLKPKAVARLADGTLLVADSHQGVIQVLETDGRFRQLVVSAEAEWRFEHPVALAVDGSALWVADLAGATVYHLEPGGPAVNGGQPLAALLPEWSVDDDGAAPVCRQCHDGTQRFAPGNWDAAAHQHPLDVPDDMTLPTRLRTGKDGDLTCTSCHALHALDVDARRQDVVEVRHVGPDETTLPPRPSCADCHAERVSPAPAGQRTEHPVGLVPPPGADLTALLAAGGELGADGKTVDCRTCHRPHGATYEHLLVASATDGALCLSCHADHGPSRSVHPVGVRLTENARAAVARMGGIPGEEGTLTCLSCHAPHDATAGSLLRSDGSGAAACRACHASEAAALGRDGHGGESCEDCHGMHTAPTRPGRGVKAAETEDQACVDCHAAGGGKLQVSLTTGHPMWKTATAAMATKGHTGKVGCTDCHTAHSQADRLLTEGSVKATCTGCHPQAAGVVGTDHDAAVVAVAGSDQTCLSCHPAHDKGNAPRAPGPANPASGVCLSCHDGRTTATEVEHYAHPEGVLLTVGGLPFRYSGNVPYFGPDGQPTTQREVGEITCQTCHDPHRWKHGSTEVAGAAEGTEQNSFLRSPDEVVAFCTVCHGADGRPQFRFFHSEQYREKRKETP